MILALINSNAGIFLEYIYIYIFYINIVCFRGSNLHLFVVERDQYLDDG